MAIAKAGENHGGGDFLHHTASTHKGASAHKGSSDDMNANSVSLEPVENIFCTARVESPVGVESRVQAFDRLQHSIGCSIRSVAALVPRSSVIKCMRSWRCPSIRVSCST